MCCHVSSCGHRSTVRHVSTNHIIWLCFSSTVFMPPGAQNLLCMECVVLWWYPTTVSFPCVGCAPSCILHIVLSLIGCIGSSVPVCYLLPLYATHTSPLCAPHISLLSLSTPPWSTSPHDQSVTPGDCLTCPTLAWWPLTAAISPSLRDAVRVVLPGGSTRSVTPFTSLHVCSGNNHVS